MANVMDCLCGLGGCGVGSHAISFGGFSCRSIIACKLLLVDEVMRAGRNIRTQNVDG